MRSGDRLCSRLSYAGKTACRQGPEGRGRVRGNAAGEGRELSWSPRRRKTHCWCCCWCALAALARCHRPCVTSTRRRDGLTPPAAAYVGKLPLPTPASAEAAVVQPARAGSQPGSTPCVARRDPRPRRCGGSPQCLAFPAAALTTPRAWARWAACGLKRCQARPLLAVPGALRSIHLRPAHLFPGCLATHSRPPRPRHGRGLPPDLDASYHAARRTPIRLALHGLI